jgi:DNA polymerase III epsilon subunit-like protein
MSGHRGGKQHQQSRQRRGPTVVFFDLETTGFDRPIRPVQIGAVDSWGECCFNEYVWPRRHVHPKATLTNNFYTKRNNLYHHGEKVACLDLEDALAAFLEWLEELGGDVVLVAHKCLDYDAKVLLRNMEEFNIPYSNIIRGFSDSLLASRQLYTEAPSHKLSAMLYEVGLPVREEHDALEDAADCRRICRRMAGQCKFRFMDFIMDSNWYHTVDQQWDWTFPSGYPTF